VVRKSDLRQAGGNRSLDVSSHLADCVAATSGVDVVVNEGQHAEEDT
jgi:hypothetical protein